jgi:two-component system, NtrC family, sensor kinase
MPRFPARWVEAMRKPSRTGGKPVKARRDKTVTLKHNGPKAVRRRSSSAAGLNKKVALLARERDELLEQQTATAEILQVINRSPGDLTPVFDAMLEKAMHLCEAAFGQLAAYDGERFRTSATRGVPAAFAEYRRNNPPNYGPGTTPSRILEGERVICTDDLKAEPAYQSGEPNRRALVDLGGARSALIVALRKDDAVPGFIQIYRQEVRPFSDKQIELIKNFASQAVIAIENARLLNELRQRTDDLAESLEQQTATSDVLGVISRSKFELQPILQSVVDTAARLCRAEAGVIFRREDGIYRFAAGYSLDPAYLEIERKTPIVPGQGTVVGRAAMTGQVARIDDAWTDPLYEKKQEAKIGKNRSMIGVPLMREGEPIGVIGLARSRVDPFTEREIDLVTTFADQAVIAIENVRLFEAEQQRTQELARSIEDLRTAQDRLIQTEKLASLGQLTAGIAHEIKNPLNFVNNFSSVSVELIDELREALSGAHLDSKLRAKIAEIADMLQGNLDKGRAARQARRRDRQEHAAAFATGLWRAPAGRHQRPRRGEPQPRLSRGAGREAGLQYHPGAVL